jgi:hypothetical protein
MQAAFVACGQLSNPAPLLRRKKHPGPKSESGEAVPIWKRKKNTIGRCGVACGAA